MKLVSQEEAQRRQRETADNYRLRSDVYVPPRRRSTPVTPISRFSSHAPEQLPPAMEQDDTISPYKVQVRDPETDETIVRAPRKNLFGENGLMSSSSQGSLPKLHKKTALIRKVKRYAGDAIQKLDELRKRWDSPKRPRLQITHNFAVSLGEEIQSQFYTQIELCISNEANRFLLEESRNNHVSPTSVRKTIEEWSKKGRPHVLEFRYDLETQHDLVDSNRSTLSFSGVNAFTHGKLHSVLAAWKVLAREISIRTFCHADSSIRKHMSDAERVLELIGTPLPRMIPFLKVCQEVENKIRQEEKRDRERRLFNGVEREWIPGG